ncbi:MAG: hypothetical protein HY926_03155 [Elusimicrobia bacterium]|nr:hypothetical protein [Elusimicrobiota bacterium]
MRKATLFLCAALAACGPAVRRPAWVGASGTDLEGVGMGSYQAHDPEGPKKARDAAYNDAMQKLSLKLRAKVRGEVQTSLRSSGQDSEQTVESVTGSVVDLALGRKRFEEFRDERRREYWVRCAMSREEADAAVKEALAEATRRRSEKSVALALSSPSPALAKLAEAEFTRRFMEKGYWILPPTQAAAARILVSGELKSEELGSARPLGVEVGLACRAVLAPEAVVARGTPGERKVAGRSVKDATGFGRTQSEACEKAAGKAAAQAAAVLADAVSGAIED